MNDESAHAQRAVETSEKICIRIGEIAKNIECTLHSEMSYFIRGPNSVALVPPICLLILSTVVARTLMSLDIEQKEFVRLLSETIEELKPKKSEG